MIAPNLSIEIIIFSYRSIFSSFSLLSAAQELSIVSDDIRERDKVYLTGSPDTIGMVFSISDVSGTKKYEVFVDGEIKTFYEGQIQKIDSAPSYSWIDLNTLQSNLTAYEINNPSAGNLYSLNAARIDFVPYQFRPALKLIKSLAEAYYQAKHTALLWLCVNIHAFY